MNKTKYLGLDYGLKRIGIAVSDDEKRFSFSRDHILNDSVLQEKLFRIIKDENISLIVIGYPLNLNSKDTDLSGDVIKFRDRLRTFLKNHSLEVELHLFDERFTSSIAQSAVFASGLKRKKRHNKGLVDSISAQIILQDFIDNQKITKL